MYFPPDLRGRPHADRAMKVVGTFLTRYLNITGGIDYNPKVAGHNPDSVLQLEVVGRDTVAAGSIAVITVASPTGAELPPWHPGSHLDLHLPSGRRRQYSLCGDPDDRHSYRIAVRRIDSGGGGSVEMHALEPGSLVTVRGPRNGFPFVGTGSALFVAGGIGITPIIAMVRAAQRLDMDWQFVYCGRSRDTMPFLDEIAGWDQSRVFVRTDDEYGVPANGELLDRAVPGGAVYCCGPMPMLDAVRRDFRDSAATALHFERFGPPPIKNGTPFEVQLVSSGQVLPVAADVSALTAVKAERPDIGYSCQQGFCGTCKVRVLAGEPEHLESRLTPEEQKTHMLICVSRSRTERLILDL